MTAESDGPGGMKYRDHNFLGITQSLCPECLKLVTAKIVVRNDRVYFRKRCPEHGLREDFVCSDVHLFDQTNYSLPGKVPATYAMEPDRGCPYDCGLCTEHEQHTCIGLLEITSSCNLECPICFAGSGPGGDHLTFEQCRAAIDRLVEVETRPEVLQLSGGEPTIHPQFQAIFEYACNQPIDIVMINTNGIRIARDDAFVDMLASWKHRSEIYFQFDTFEDVQTQAIRGESLVKTKLKAIERLGQAGIRTTLVCTLQSGVNEQQIGPLARFAAERPWITGLSFQPTTYTGRYFLPEDLEDRITFPDILTRLEQQTAGVWKASDFSPLPCAHPNGHSLAYGYRTVDTLGGNGVASKAAILPLARFIDFEQHLDLLAGRITFDRPGAKSLIETYLRGVGCSPLGSGFPEACSPAGTEQGRAGRSQSSSASLATMQTALQALAETMEEMPQTDRELMTCFLQRAMTQTLAPENMLRITTTSFMDAYNFDVRQLMKSCVHHMLPSGHLIPFSAYNVLYRDGHVPLPDLKRPDLVTLGG